MEHVSRLTMWAIIGISLLLNCFAVGKDVECEVCTTVLQRLSDGLPSEDRTNPAKVEAKLRKDCSDIRQPQEHRFCYYVGGLEESATSTINELVKPLSWGMPVEKICEKLRKKDSQICDLKYEKALDWKTLDINKLKVKDLKKILGDWGEDCKGCAEKSDFVKKVQEVKPKYVKEEL